MRHQNQQKTNRQSITTQPPPYKNNEIALSGSLQNKHQIKKSKRVKKNDQNYDQLGQQSYEEDRVLKQQNQVRFQQVGQNSGSDVVPVKRVRRKWRRFGRKCWGRTKNWVFFVVGFFVSVAFLISIDVGLQILQSSRTERNSLQIKHNKDAPMIKGPQRSEQIPQKTPIEPLYPQPHPPQIQPQPPGSPTASHSIQHPLTSSQLDRYYNSIKRKIKISKIPARQIINNRLITIIINSNIDLSLENNVEDKKFNVYKDNMQYLFKMWKIGVCQIILVEEGEDQYGELVRKFVSDYRANISMYSQDVDSSYKFVLSHISPISNRVLYCHGSTPLSTISSLSAQTLQQKQQHEKLKVQKLCNNPNKQSSQTNNNNIIFILEQCTFLFNPIYYKLITPLNFQYQTVYTIDQLLLIPILNINMAFHDSLYPIDDLRSQIKRFQLQVLGELEVVEVCLVAGNSQGGVLVFQEIIAYLKCLQPLKKLSIKKISVILVISSASPIPLDLLQTITNFPTHINIRIKQRSSNISLPLQIYEVSRWYCHKNGVIISSKMNSCPQMQNIYKYLQEESKNIKNNEQKSKNNAKIKSQLMCRDANFFVLIGGFIDQSGTIHQGPNQINLKGKRVQYDYYYQQYLQYGQIMCASILRYIMLTHVKWQQTIFYSTQYSFVIPALQLSNSKIKLTKESLFKLQSNPTKQTTYLNQINNLRIRQSFLNPNSPSLNSWPSPIQFNQLSNIGYRNTNIQLIPRIIHQIWLSTQQKMSTLKQQLMITVKKINPQFQYRLWTYKDVNQDNFKYTYSGIQKYEKLGKKMGKNYRALIADLMRIQILYLYGGIYLDMKVQGRKSLLPFLKFQQFFYTISKQGLVNGVIGSMQGHPKFKYILQQLFRPEKLNVPKEHIYDQTGGTVLRKAYSQRYIYTRLLDILQFVGGPNRPCIYGNFNKQPLEGQKVYEGKTSKGAPYRIFIPCMQDDGKYLELYNVLGRTYFPNAQNYN